jgi:hypothetical protein
VVLFKCHGLFIGFFISAGEVFLAGALTLDLQIMSEK